MGSYGSTGSDDSMGWGGYMGSSGAMGSGGSMGSSSFMGSDGSMGPVAPWGGVQWFHQAQLLQFGIVAMLGTKALWGTTTIKKITENLFFVRKRGGDLVCSQIYCAIF